MTETIFAKLLAFYVEASVRAQQQNLNSDHLEQMMKRHIRELISTGKGGEILDGYRGDPTKEAELTGCQPGYVCCEDGSCQPIIVGCPERSTA
jgi:hypothetical protein